MKLSVSLWGLGATSLGVVLAPVVAPAAEAPGVWQLQHPSVLGAPANFLVTAHSDEHAKASVSAALAEIERLDGVFNSRRPSSELSALNASARMTVSPELFAVIEKAEDMRTLSGGAYSGRLGEVLAAWRAAETAAPSPEKLQSLATATEGRVVLDRTNLTVERADGVSFALDSIAKGYIVDAALEAGLKAAPVKGFLVDIGGDMRCAGPAPDGPTWNVGVPDPASTLDRAPLVAEAHLRDKAIATSGRGPRDHTIAGQTYSVTLSPKTGWAAEANIAATVIADRAADADAFATALLVMPAHEGLALAERSNGIEARITDKAGMVRATTGWRNVASEPPARLIRIADTPPPPGATGDRWMADWAVQMIYQAPDKAVERRQSDFRTPYMAMWITDKNNKPVRTIVLVGQRTEWQKDNYIWWGMYKDRAPKLVELRSTATALSGAYPTYWPGYNDDWKFMPQGEYVLHIETSREKGKHTYRTVPLTLGKKGFTTTVPKTEEGGGLLLTYGHRD